MTENDCAIFRTDLHISYLQSMVPLEETTGITFKNITLLTKAFIHSSCTDTKITG